MEEDTGEGMQCSEHPLRTNPHGICPLCLQDKLGKLLSLPLPIRPSSSSSTPPSPPSLPSLPPPSSLNSNNNNHNHRRHRLPFLSTRKNNKHTTKPKPKPSLTPPPSSSSSAVFKRSKSTVTPRRATLLDNDHPADNNNPIPRKRNRFWSFLHVSSKNNNHNHHHSTTPSMKLKEKCEAASSSSSSLSLVSRKISIVVEDNEEEACTHATNNSNNNSGSSRQASSSTCSSLERKVSRSRSVGCGSRSFSGDFFERISTGFGDCALRRVESHREGKPSSKSNHRARCGGLFSGFIIHSSFSSSSSSSYLVEESRHHHHQTTARKSSESRGKYWAWPLFASPMRVFTTAKPSHAKDVVHKNNATSPNLSAIPSLLAVRG